MLIYQIYHNKNQEPSLLKEPYIMPYYTKSEPSGKNINHIQDFINEFVCHYYVAKNNLHKPDDVVGFCHYRRTFDINEKEIPIIESAILDSNIVMSLCYYGIKGIIEYKDKNNFLYISIKDYLDSEYPELSERFKNLDFNVFSVRCECFICKYEDLQKLVDFVLGYFRFHKVDLEKDSIDYIDERKTDFEIDYWKDNEHWYFLPELQKRRLAHVIEALVALYWAFEIDDKKIFNLWGDYPFKEFEIL